MAVLHARKIAPQQAGLLLDVALRKPALQAMGANGGADLHHGRTPPTSAGFTALAAILELLTQELTRTPCRHKRKTPLYLHFSYSPCRAESRIRGDSRGQIKV